MIVAKLWQPHDVMRNLLRQAYEKEACLEFPEPYNSASFWSGNYIANTLLFISVLNQQQLALFLVSVKLVSTSKIVFCFRLFRFCLATRCHLPLINVRITFAIALLKTIESFGILEPKVKLLANRFSVIYEKGLPSLRTHSSYNATTIEEL